MKILQINKRHWDHIGGIETVLQNATEALRLLGYECIVLTVSEDNNYHQESQPGLHVGKARQTGKLFGMPLSWQFFSIAKNYFQDVDLVILHHPFPLGFLAYWLFGRKAPLIVWYHSDIIRQQFLGWLLGPLLRKVLSQANTIIVSNQTVHQSSNLLQPYHQKIAVMPYMVEQHQPAAEDVQTINTKYGSPLVLSVGRLVYYKGFEYLIQAMRDVPAQLLIIGSGPLETNLEELIAARHLNNVTILNHVKDLTPYYHAADIFVLPSVENSEAFGIVQIEAMLAGKPVINTSLPTAVPTVSLHQQTGLTVPPKNESLLREAIVNLLNDSELRMKYGSAALQRAQQVYSKQAFQDNLQKLVQKIINV